MVIKRWPKRNALGKSISTFSLRFWESYAMPSATNYFMKWASMRSVVPYDIAIAIAILHITYAHTLQTHTYIYICIYLVHVYHADIILEKIRFQHEVQCVVRMFSTRRWCSMLGYQMTHEFRWPKYSRYGVQNERACKISITMPFISHTIKNTYNFGFSENFVVILFCIHQID